MFLKAHNVTKYQQLLLLASNPHLLTEKARTNPGIRNQGAPSFKPNHLYRKGHYHLKMLTF